MPHELFFIGEMWYKRSGWQMSPLWEEVDSKYESRSWREVLQLLAQGDTVELRPATDVELVWAKTKSDDWEHTNA